VPCPKDATVGVDVLAGVDHTLVAVGSLGGLYTLTVLTVALITLVTPRRAPDHPPTLDTASPPRTMGTPIRVRHIPKYAQHP
jgi:hypothetical protein